MLRLLTREKVDHIVDAADRRSAAIYSGIAFDSADCSGVYITTLLQIAPKFVASCDSAELVAALNALAREEQVELAALFYSGRDGAEYYAMMPNGRNIAGPDFGAYLGGKRRFAQYVRVGLDKLGYSVKE